MRGAPFALTLAVLSPGPGAVCARAGERSPAADVPIPQIIQEFLRTESVFPQAPGELQFRVGGEYSRARAADPWQAPLSLEVEYGITRRFQVSAAAGWMSSQDIQGERTLSPTSMGVGFLFNVLPGAHSLAMSVALQTTRPAGDERTEVEVSMILAKAFEAMQLHFNVATARAAGQSAWQANVAALFPAERWVPTLELSASRDSDATRLYVVPGLHWRVSDRSNLSFGFLGGLNRHSDDFALLAAFVIEL